jgi:hypothetical protein
MPRGGKRKGAGRKAIGDAPRQRITITLSNELVQWIDAQSENRSKFIEKLLRRAEDGGTEEG